MRLIDADALLLIFASKIKKITPIGYSRDAFHHDSGRNGAWVGARIEVNKAPTIDAVPVIRCKNCQHFAEFRAEAKKYGADGTCRLLIMKVVENDFSRVKATDFCSYGKPKTET